jgi:hypothetical protein
MRVVFSHSIKRKEFRKNIPNQDLQIILDSLTKGIFAQIKGENLPKGSKLIKIYATIVAGARRIVFLVDVSSGDAFFLFYRTKNDKIGKNITIKNQEFKKYLHIYLNLLDKDLDSGKLDIFEI